MKSEETRGGQEIPAGAVEHIVSGGRLLAIVVSREHQPPATEFVTGADLNLQVGFIKYPAGGEIRPHRHRPPGRQIDRTCEVLVVRSGATEAFIYDEEGRLAARRVLKAGDLVLLAAGGHGFRMLADTVLLEVKQGPYLGKETEPFEHDPGK